MDQTEEFLKALRDAERARMRIFWRDEASIPVYLTVGKRDATTCGDAELPCLSQGRD